MYATSSRRVPEAISFRSYLTAGLAVLLAAEVAFIGWYAYQRVQALLDPENVADRAEKAIRTNYPEFRQELVARVEDQAPQIAEQVSQEIISAIPAARQELEELTARQLEAGLDRATELSADQFRQVLQENRATFLQAFELVETAPEEARQLVLSTEAGIHERLGVDLQEQARGALAFHRRLNDKLERLADPNATLDSKELLERQIVRILRTMQTEETARIAALPPEARPADSTVR